MFTCTVIAQTGYSTEKQDSSNVYHKAIIEFSNYLQKQFPDVDEVNFEAIPITTMFPDNINGIEINYIPRSEIERQFKKGKIKYYCVISPMQLKDGIFFVNVIPFKVDYQKNLWSEYKKKEIGFISQGGIKSKFQYDAKNSNLKFLGSEGGFQNIE